MTRSRLLAPFGVRWAIPGAHPRSSEFHPPQEVWLQEALDRNTAKISAALDGICLSISPPIMRFGDEWGLSTENWVYLSSPKMPDKVDKQVDSMNMPSSAWNADGGSTGSC